MGRAHSQAMLRCGVFVLIGVIALSYAEPSQTHKKAKGKGTSAKAAAQKARADSIAAARADSTRAALRAKAIADSTTLGTQALARQDSAKPFQFRTVKNDAFGVGERLVFDVNYEFITAGEAVMAVTGFDSVAGRKCYRIEFSVKSLPTFSLFYRVQDHYLTFIDVETMAPWKFEQHIQEGTYRRDFVAEFDQVNHVARTSEGSYPTPEYVHDILSAFYFARTIDFSGFKVNDATLLHNFYKDKSNDLVVKVLGRQELEVEAGTFNTVVVEPLVREGGLFKSEGRIVIWMTDDDHKIPVRVNTKVIVGSIDVELREYSGIAGPVRARIK